MCPRNSWNGSLSAWKPIQLHREQNPRSANAPKFFALFAAVLRSSTPTSQPLVDGASILKAPYAERRMGPRSDFQIYPELLLLLTRGSGNHKVGSPVVGTAHSVSFLPQCSGENLLQRQSQRGR